MSTIMLLILILLLIAALSTWPTLEAGVLSQWRPGPYRPHLLTLALSAHV